MTPGVPPRHVACIMDGNGRWAQHRGLERTHGHMAARAALEAAVDGALEHEVEWLTLFAFSTENWSRPEEEVSFLVRFLAQHVIGRGARSMHERGVRLRLLGRTDPRVPAEVLDRLREAEELTRDNSTLQLSLAFNYGGRQDLCEAARSLLLQEVPAAEITDENLARHMLLPELPDVDLLLRTGGEHRLSNFLLWHCAYAELVFLDVLWPDFRTVHLRHAVELYQQRQRRFGTVGRTDAADAAAPTVAGTAAAPPDAAPPAVEATAPAIGTGLVPSLAPSALLSLPTSIASHLGATLWDGLRETARSTLHRLTGEPTGPGRDNQSS
ncbi:polyprenyl diphosphate synthase [Streptomyces spirodelae]|uniref:Isoprenyl transferase n=1 Tax=Streptomyces spirodelae TaxID=2812904 RepID=A0ABS3WMC5_9ACTN|nr:polyprenyl diphosphate synthase [Streptomyces spirodelae]MBO8184271.1 di-trans,poly-cis-decaprenylcistransferase [Streptomyces spirodelae]